MTNTLKLKSLFVLNGLTQQEVAEKIGISYQSLSLKINNKREFKQSEISKLCEILNIKDGEKIFFCGWTWF